MTALRHLPVSAVLLTGALAAGPLSAAQVCPAPTQEKAGEFTVCSDSGGWHLAAPGWTRAAQPTNDGGVTLSCAAAVCGSAMLLDVDYANGNENIKPATPFTRESYLARWNEKGLYDLAWLDSEDDGKSEPAKDFKGRVAMKTALFHFKNSDPKKPPYDRLVAITWGKDQIYMFRFKGEPGKLANNDKVAAILNSIEVME